jgi:hypothetical protein
MCTRRRCVGRIVIEVATLLARQEKRREEKRREEKRREEKRREEKRREEKRREEGKDELVDGAAREEAGQLVQKLDKKLCTYENRRLHQVFPSHGHNLSFR